MGIEYLSERSCSFIWRVQENTLKGILVDTIYVFIAVETVLIIVPALHRLRDDRRRERGLGGGGWACSLRVGWSIWAVCTQHCAESHMPTLQTVLTATGTNCFVSVIVQSQKQSAIVFTTDLFSKSYSLRGSHFNEPELLSLKIQGFLWLVWLS